MWTAVVRTVAGMTVAPTISGLEAPPTAAVARTIHAIKTYGSGDTTVRALDDVSVELPAGRFTAIMGPSGSGKSTLMHCLAGLDTLTAGQVFIGDDDLGRLSDRQLTQLRRDRIGFVFQSYNLVPTLTALENITLPDVPRRPEAGPGVARRGHRHRRPA